MKMSILTEFSVLRSLENVIAGFGGLLIGWLFSSFFKISRTEFKEYILEVNHKLDAISQALATKADREELKDAIAILRDDIREAKFRQSRQP